MKSLFNNGCILLAFSLGAVAPAQAQYQNAGTINYRYTDYINKAASVSPLGDDLFGDATDRQEGATSFTATDVSLPTNVRLPVQIGRRLQVMAAGSGWKVQYNPLPDIFGKGWSAEVPYIESDALRDYGWLDGQVAYGGSARCSGGQFSVNAIAVSQVVVEAFNFFHGVDINIPSYGRERLLALAPGAVTPGDGATYVGTTRAGWKVSCLGSTKNYPGEGFVVTLNDGAKYYFDWMATADTGYISTARGDLYLRKFRLYATKAVDRFGGSITYSYDPASPHHLTSISSSDGVSINLSYAASGKVSSVTDGRRTWQYLYSDGGAPSAWDVLTTVVLPDQSRWTYSAPPGSVSASAGGTTACQVIVGTRTSSASPGPNEAQTFRITHPSGVVGEFRFRPIMFGVNRYPIGCDGYPGLVHIGNALYFKSMSGVGIPEKTWQISYFPSWSYASSCTTGCPTTSETVVTESGGRTTRYVYGNDYQTNEGKLLSTTLSTTAATVSSTEFRYLTSVAGQPFPDVIGTNNFQRSNPFLFKNRPLEFERTVQDGTYFTRSVNAFDRFVRPIRITRSSQAVN